MRWHAQTIKQVFQEVESSAQGLTFKEVKRRRKIVGFNKLPEPEPTPLWKRFLSHFHNPLVYILLVVVGVSLWLAHFMEALFVFLVVLVNGLVSFFQEGKADKTLDKLKETVKLQARVWREGSERQVDSRQLVPGDIIKVRAGDQVPADARIINSQNLKVSQASLTGEFWSVEKNSQKMRKEEAPIADRKNMIWMGTEVEEGQAKAVVVATSRNSQLGSLALTVRQTKKEKTPLQKKILSFSRWLGGGIVFLGLVIFLIGYFLGTPFSEIFYTSLALVVSVVPEGLLPVITVALIIGVGRVLQKGGLVRKLAAVETLGSTDVICFDKTGTLTQGKMSLKDLITDQPKIAWKIMANANGAVLEKNQSQEKSFKILGRPTDRALLQAALDSGVEPRLDEVSFLPFDSEKKFLAKAFNDFIYIAGAPEVLLRRSSLNSASKKRWQKQVKRLASQGLRLIALGYKKSPGNFSAAQKEHLEPLIQDINFVGLAVLADPLRSEAAQSIKVCQQAGLRPIIVTGDHILTARRIAQEVGLKVSVDQFLQGEKLSALSDKQLEEKISRINLFSRVTPQQKLRLVRAWQAHNKTVAMTGDGVNDAPALKAADIGVCLRSGTDVSREAADIVLLKNSFSTILSAIKQGRIIFANIKKAIIYLLSTDFSEVVLVAGSVFMGLPLPLLPTQILWINIAEDTLPDFALTQEKGDPGVVGQQAKTKTSIFSQPVRRLIFAAGLVRAVVALALFVLLWRLWGGRALKELRSLVLVLEILNSMIFAFICRSLNRSLWRRDIFSNWWLNGSVVLGLLALIAAVYFPPLQWALQTTSLSLVDWGIVVFVSIFDTLLIEVFKKKYVIK